MNRQKFKGDFQQKKKKKRQKCDIGGQNHRETMMSFLLLLRVIKFLKINDVIQNSIIIF